MKTQEHPTVKKAIVIDVRTPGEFLGGSAKGAINIPLSEIQDRLEEIREMNAPVILCCASGNRSGQAVHFLKSVGIESCSNGGSWFEVDHR